MAHDPSRSSQSRTIFHIFLAILWSINACRTARPEAAIRADAGVVEDLCQPNAEILDGDLRCMKDLSFIPNRNSCPEILTRIDRAFTEALQGNSCAHRVYLSNPCHLNSCRCGTLASNDSDARFDTGVPNGGCYTERSGANLQVQRVYELCISAISAKSLAGIAHCKCLLSTTSGAEESPEDVRQPTCVEVDGYWKYCEFAKESYEINKQYVAEHAPQIESGNPFFPWVAAVESEESFRKLQEGCRSGLYETQECTVGAGKTREQVKHSILEQNILIGDRTSDEKQKFLRGVTHSRADFDNYVSRCKCIEQGSGWDFTANECNERKAGP